MRQGKRLQLSYDGFTRVVEVHAVGTTKDGHQIARVYRIRGGSQSNNPSPWRLLRLDEAFAASILNEKSEAPRAGYKRGDNAMEYIICQI